MRNLLLLLGFAIINNLQAGDLTIPNTFTTGSPAVAADVNANFAAVETEVDDNNASIVGNASGISTNASSITSNDADITGNAAGIVTNASGISTNASAITTNASSITSNDADITGNAAGIVTNASGISTNASSITSNDADITGNAAGIVTNTSGVATNASSITSNDADITGNAAGIVTNASGVATNASSITSNDADITGNVAGIATNVTDIAIKQNRVDGLCSPEEAIGVINADGTVICETFTMSNSRLDNLEAIANSTQIFDSRDFDISAGVSSRLAGSSLGMFIMVSADTTITRISVLNEMKFRGNIRFVIFDHANHSQVLLTVPQPLAADDASVLTWKESVPFNFTLLAGQSYDIGAIADVEAGWAFDTTADNVLNITSVLGNAVFIDFNNPVVTLSTSNQHGTSGADIPVRLFGLLP